MSTVKRRTVKGAARRISKLTGVPLDAVRKALREQIRFGNLPASEYNFTTFAGLLPVYLPDGTKVAVLPDIHVPAHNRNLMWAVLEALRDYQPDIVVLIGDVADIFGLSAWPAHPGIKRDIVGELEETKRVVDDIIEVSGCAHVFFIMGNHEDRVWRHIVNVDPKLGQMIDPDTREPLLSLPNLMGFRTGDPVTFLFDLMERGGFGGGIVLTDENGTPDFEFHHGYIVRPAPGASPMADSNRSGRSTGTGHTHRTGVSIRETTTGEVVSAEFGNLVDKTHAYMGYANMLNNWSSALGFGTVVGGKLHPEVVPVRDIETPDGQQRQFFVWQGKEYVSATA